MPLVMPLVNNFKKQLHFNQHLFTDNESLELAQRWFQGKISLFGMQYLLDGRVTA